MLSKRDLQLLTACVDGELSPRQRRHVERLLKRSAEARVLLRQLQADSRHLLELPRTSAPPDLADSVMAAVGQVKRRPAAARPRPVPTRTFPAWTGWAAAAAVLVAVGLGTFLRYFDAPTGDPSVAKNGKQENDKSKPGGENNVVKRDAGPKQPEEDPVPPEDPTPPDRDPPTPTPDKPTPIHKPIPEKPPEPVFGDGSTEPFSKVERVVLALPVVLKLHEQLTDRSAVRIEMPAKNATRAFERVKAALDARKIKLVIDPAAQTKLKTPQFRHDYGLFFENVTAADLAEILAAIAELDRTAGEKKASEQRFDGSLVVKAVSWWDRKELTDLLGVDPMRVRPAPPKPANVDLRKPLSEQTGKQVDDVLDGKRAPRPNTTQPGQSVLVVPLGSRSRSAEVKRFLEGRKPAREGTLQVFLVLRQLPS
jgi:hypothetical protein